MEFTVTIESDEGVGGVVTKKPVTKTIAFGSKPVKLPDGVSVVCIIQCMLQFSGYQQYRGSSCTWLFQ